MKKEDIEQLELNRAQKQILKKKLENSNFSVASSNLETQILQAEESKHKQNLINDRITLHRQLETETSKQKKKDVANNTFIMIMCIALSTYLSIQGLKRADAGREYLNAVMYMFGGLLTLNNLVLQKKAIRLSQEFKFSLTTLGAWAVSLGIMAGSIISNWMFTKYLSSIQLVNIMIAAGFDLIPLVLNISKNKFDKKYDGEKKELEEKEPLETVNLDSQKTVNLDSQKMVNFDSKNSDGQMVSIEGKQGLEEVSKTVKTDSQKWSKNLLHTSNMKGKIKSFDDLEKAIGTFEDGTHIQPKMVNMQGQKIFYSWIKKCNNVEKVNGKWIKKSNSNVIQLTKRN